MIIKQNHLPVLILIDNDSLTRANRVVEKCTVPSSFKGMFIRISFYNDIKKYKHKKIITKQK